MRSVTFDPRVIRYLLASMTVDEVMAKLGCSRATVSNAKRGFEFPRHARKPRAQRERKTLSRLEHAPLTGQSANMPAFDNPALMEGRTIYPKSVIDASDALNVLKSGVNAAKIGGLILKGKWKGYPIFTLTLEERATCPTSCHSWRSCYGNHSHWAERLKPNKSLLDRLERELGSLASKYRGGFAVRLHVLGDFFSVDYVKFWERMLDAHPALHIFGFTARWQYQDDPIAAAIVDLAQKDWSRFVIRFSNAPVGLLSTKTIEHPFQKPKDAVICPAQLGKTESCSTCAFCWQSRKRVAFIQH